MSHLLLFVLPVGGSYGNGIPCRSAQFERGTEKCFIELDDSCYQEDGPNAPVNQVLMALPPRNQIISTINIAGKAKQGSQANTTYVSSKMPWTGPQNMLVHQDGAPSCPEYKMKGVH